MDLGDSGPGVVHEVEGALDKEWELVRLVYQVESGEEAKEFQKVHQGVEDVDMEVVEEALGAEAGADIENL